MTGKRTLIREVDTVNELKQKFCQAEQHSDIRLVYGGKILEDHPLSYYGIVDGCSVHVDLRFRGGMFHSTSSRNDYSLL